MLSSSWPCPQWTATCAPHGQNEGAYAIGGARAAIKFVLACLLTHLPADIHAHCVPFGGDDWLADVAWHADVQFLAYPQPSAQPLVFETSVPQEYWEFDKGFPLDSTVNNVKGH